MKKRCMVLLLMATIPLAAFLLVDQVYRYDRLSREVSRLHHRQTELFEQNKRAVVNIAILKSPERIDRLARELGLQKGRREPLLEIDLSDTRRDRDG